MKKENRKDLIVSSCFLAAFLLWTILISYVDVQPIGPQNSAVGLAAFNGFVRRLIGVHMDFYVLTDWLSLIPVFLAAGFGLLGLIQWIQRRSIFRVDFDILLLGIFYAVVAALFLFFETCVINYRPVLIDGILEASYPSSTTLLVLCVMPTAQLQFRRRISRPTLRKCITFLIVGFTAFMVIGRLFSGVHWITDIIGGMLLSCGLVKLYRAVIGQA